MRNHLEFKHPRDYRKCFPTKSGVQMNTQREGASAQPDLNISDIDLDQDMEVETCQTKSSGIKRSQQITIEETLEKKRKFTSNDATAKELTKRICEAIAVNIQPISFTEDIGFRRIMEFAVPRYTIPSRRYFTDTAIPELYSKVFNKVKTEVSAAHYISLTSDIWTASTNNTPFISLTGHWLDKAFDQHIAVLKVLPFEGEHSGEKIGACIKKGHEQFDIPMYKIHLLLRDNAANMVKGVRDCGIESLGCFIHTLQLCIHDSIMTQHSVIEILSICRKSAGYFHRSPLGWSKFKELQERLRAHEHKLIQDVTTRWNSKYYMLQRYYEQRKTSTLYCMECEDENVKNLSESQWELVKKLVELLQPFEQITNKLSSRKVTTSSIIPTIMMLKMVLENAEKCLSGIKSTVAELRKSAETRFNCLEGDETLCLSTFLDPRYKLTVQAINLEKTTVIEWMIKIIKNEEIAKKAYKSDSESNDASSAEEAEEESNKFAGFQSSSPSLNLDNCFDMILKKKVNCDKELFEEDSQSNITASDASQSSRSKKLINKQTKLRCSLEAEVESYLNSPLMDKDSDPLSYWKINHTSFPLLKKLALKYLSAPASSVESERLFSTGGNIYQPTRNRLNPALGEILIFLHYNLRIYNFDYE